MHLPLPYIKCFYPSPQKSTNCKIENIVQMGFMLNCLADAIF